MTKEVLNEFGMTAVEMTKMLEWGAHRGHMDTIQFLLRQLLFGKDDLNNALKSAAVGGRNDMVKLLVSLGADNLDDAMGSAAFYGRTDTVMLFRDLGALDFARALLLAKLGQNRPDTVGLLRIYLAGPKLRPAGSAPAP